MPSHYLYDQYGHVLRGERIIRPLNQPSYRKSGKRQGELRDYYYRRDSERRTFYVYEYIMATLKHFTRHTALMRHAKGRPPAGCETHTEDGLLRGTVAAMAYIACLLRPCPAAEREELTSDNTAFPIFRASACHLLSEPVLAALEAYAACLPHNCGTATLPGLHGPAMDAYIDTHEEHAANNVERGLRNYDLTFPHHLMTQLYEAYGIRHGQSKPFLARVLYWFTRETLNRASDLRSHIRDTT